MTTVHVGLVCRSEDHSDRFYRDLLGLTKAAPKMFPQTLSKALFSIDADITIVNYIGNGCHFEVFICNQSGRKEHPVEHVCIDVEDLADFLKRSRALKVEILQIPKGDALLSFVYDFDGNLFELKEKPRL